VLDRLNRHDLTGKEWERLLDSCPPIRGAVAGGQINGW
jgi:hypothetical protein